MTTARKAPEPILGEDEVAEFEASEQGDWVEVGPIEEQRALWQQAARRALDGKRRRISISIPERDLARLKTRAAERGMPYQTLINSILHEFVES